MSSQRVSILRRLDPDEIRELRARDEFFWVDLALADGVSAAEIAAALELSDAAAERLVSFVAGGSPASRIQVESDLIVFPFWCSRPPDEEDEVPAGRLALFRVNVLVHGDFLVTVHEDRVDLPELVAEGGIAAGRSERYVVYVVLDGMTNALLETLSAIEVEIGRIENTLLESGLQPRPREQRLIRQMRLDLTALRLRVGPERSLFERVSEEIDHVSGLEPDPADYFERILAQLDRTVDRIDAASGALSNLLQVKLNETTYRLTVVATVFLPLTFITGFFGMNFGWLVGNIDTSTDFWVLGIGALSLPLLALRCSSPGAGPRARRAVPARPDRAPGGGARGRYASAGTASTGSAAVGSRWRCEAQYLVPSSASRWQRPPLRVNASQSRRISARSCSIFARATASLLVMSVHTRRCVGQAEHGPHLAEQEALRVGEVVRVGGETGQCRLTGLEQSLPVVHLVVLRQQRCELPIKRTAQVIHPWTSVSPFRDWMSRWLTHSLADANASHQRNLARWSNG